MKMREHEALKQQIMGQLGPRAGVDQLIGKATDPAPTRAVAFEVHGIHRDLASLEELVATLIGRLQPVIAGSPDQLATGAAQTSTVGHPGQVCELAEQINAAASRVRRVTGQLAEALDSLQI